VRLRRWPLSRTRVLYAAASIAPETHLRFIMMNVRDAMTPDPATCDPTTTLRLVAMLMLDHDCAAVPVVSGGEVVGIVTDRDIACRAVAQNTAP